MALTSAPWLNINPLDVLSVAERGANLGLERNRLALQEGEIRNQADEAAGRLGLGYAQLASENSNTGAANALRAQAAQNALTLALGDRADRAKEDAALNLYRFSELGARAAGLDLNKQKFDAAEKSKNDVSQAASDLLKEIGSGTDITAALSKYPLASRDPAIRSLAIQDQIAKRTSSTQDAINKRSQDRLLSRTLQFRISDLSREIRNHEGALNNPNLDLDDDTKKRMTEELKQLKDQKSELEKEFNASGPAGGTIGAAGTNPDDPLGILGKSPTAPADAGSMTPPDDE